MVRQILFRGRCYSEKKGFGLTELHVSIEMNTVSKQYVICETEYTLNSSRWVVSASSDKNEKQKVAEHTYSFFVFHNDIYEMEVLYRAIS